MWLSNGLVCTDHPEDEVCELPCPLCDEVCDPVKRRKMTQTERKSLFSVR